MTNQVWNPNPANLEVLACHGWDGRPSWAVLDRNFVAPSPNMPHLVTAQHYSGACLIEGTTFSEGRGTALPFELVGAPDIDAWALVGELEKQDIAGVMFRPHRFTPSASKHAGKVCSGIQVHITNAQKYDPLRAWLQIIRVLLQMHPDDFWLPAHNGVQHFDRLIGSKAVRPKLNSGIGMDDMMAEWDAFTQAFRRERSPFLLYPDTEFNA